MPLTTDQIVKINQSKKKIPPTYYDAEDKNTYAISSATENALILLGSETKRQAIDYLKAFVDAEPGKTSEDYNELLGEFMAQQDTNSMAITAELDALVGKFNDFRSTFAADSNNAADITISAGMQPIMEVMTKTMGRLGEIQRSEYYHETVNSVMSEVFAQEVTDELKKEMRSWIRVIASYP